ncbi:MAG TPA: flavin reductase family protein [Kineosporiaceae bacterium]|nr:flavin reductase family protein [Kineosporiaceae bacterium]
MSFAMPENDVESDSFDVLPEVGPDGLRRIFRRHAAAVAVVTTTHRGAPVGLLVTSLASVSATPPLVSFNVARSSSSWPALAQAEHIGVHVLEAGQEELAVRFASKGADRFAAPTTWWSGPHRTPVIHGAAAWAVAEVEQQVPAGDHVIVVARLLWANARDEADPLVHHDGQYRQVSGAAVPPENPVGSRFSVIRASPASAFEKISEP